MTKRITILAGHHVQALDVTGPASVFSAAAQNGAEYSVSIVSPEGGLIQTTSGIELNSNAACKTPSEISCDTLLIAGHNEAGSRMLIKDEKTKAWFSDVASAARRYGSICSGAFILGAWGYLEGRRATTHWEGIAQFKAAFPNVRLDEDALYVVDGNIWTSAGITSGIDMALAMVEADYDADLAAKIAKHLVVYLRRPGHQSQFSHALKAQGGAKSTYGDLVDWMRENLSADLSVETLAHHAGQSVRTFQRRFAKEIGATPAAFVEDLRLEQAKLLISSNMPLQRVASKIGYQGSSQLSIVFRRRFGVSPSIWKSMHAG